MPADVRRSVQEILEDLRSLNSLRELLSRLNYDPVLKPIGRHGWGKAADALAEAPQIVAAHGDFQIIYLRLVSNNLLITLERPVINKLLQQHPYALFVFSTKDQAYWHFVNVKYDKDTSKRRIYRRITVGPNEKLRTATDRLSLLDLETISPDLFGIQPLTIQARHDEAFDVEAVSKKFYLGYRELFWKFVDAIKANNKGKAHFMGDDGEMNARRYTQLIMGRVLFLYFIQKKGWLDKDYQFLRNQFNQYKKGPKKGFHSWFLSQLFFEGLNKEGTIKKIGGQEHAIPFLNGGLFEPKAMFFEGDPVKGPLIPDDKIEALLDYLDSYNFTITESTPLDQDVDIDPEMLGRVFENILAADDRHASGTYYTPRNIVSFMCRESLYQHLFEKVGLDREIYDDIFEALLYGRTPKVDKATAKKIFDTLGNTRILDPAVGSGAFLLGMLHELMNIRIVCGQVQGESAGVKEQRYPDWKRGIIGRNLFGVDNNPEACEIARLRLWLSMVVDEDKPLPLPNLDYRIVEGDTLREKLDGEPILPPIEGPGFEKEEDLFKATKPQGGLFVSARQDLTASIVKHLKAYYKTHDDEEKKRLRESISQDLARIVEDHWSSIEGNANRVIDDILEKAIRTKVSEKDMPKDWAKRQAEARATKDKVKKEKELFERHKQLPITPLRLYFAEAFQENPRGFDIVIANPPYVRQEIIRPIKPQLKEEFEDFFTSTADLYTYFYARGLELLKECGVLCFIAPNKFMRAGYGKKTRELLAVKNTPKLVIDFGELPVFEAGTDPSIILVKKQLPNGKNEFSAASIKAIEEIENLDYALSKRSFPMRVESLSPDGWTLEDQKVLDLMKKLKAAGKPLSEYVGGRFYRGVLTGFNKAFVIDEDTRKRLIKEDPKSKELIKPWLRGRDIKKWRAEWAGLYVIFTRRGVNINDYPAIKAHLSQFKKELEPEPPNYNRVANGRWPGRKAGPYKWYEIQDNIAYYAEFEKPKIIYPDIAKLMRAIFDTKGFMGSNTIYILPTDDLYILGTLHSSLFDLYSRHKFQPLGDPYKGGRLRYFSQYMESVPVFKATAKQKAPIIKLVEKILADPTSPQVPKLEAEIDELVFDLYGLTKDERDLVMEKCKAVDVSDDEDDLDDGEQRT